MRICATCGKRITFGCMQDNDGSFYTHEGKCFFSYMDKTYGEHRWMYRGVKANVYDGGYYLVTNDENTSGFDDPGIFYTEYETEDPVYCDDITGWIGRLLASDTSDIPSDAVSYLEKAYDACVDSL